jgi:hypothetical protein
MPFTSIDFLPEDYSKLYSFEDKVKYVTNLNNARNYFLINRDANIQEHCVLPLDGNCFFTLHGWYRTTMSYEFDRPFVIIQMARVDYMPINSHLEVPQWYETYRFGNRQVHGPTEPQIAFLPQSDIIYNEDYGYGNASKLELLYRIGYSGVWDNWYPEIRARAQLKKSSFYRKCCEGGFCYRLPSGVPEAEVNNQIRAKLREDGVKELVRIADKS